MSDDRSAFDPRFDPAFQRGYDGPAGDSGRAPAQRPAPETRTAPVRSSADPRTTPVVATEPLGEPVAREVERARVVDDVDDERRRINPWLIAIAAISAVLILGGLYLVSRLRDLFADTQNSADFDYVTLQVMIIAAPLAIGLGVAAAVGLLFVMALRRR